MNDTVNEINTACINDAVEIVSRLRPSVMKQETFDENFQSVVSGETTPTQLRKNLGMTHSTFYRYRKTFYEKYPELSNSAN